MVRYLVERTFNATKKYVEGACLYSDTKPTAGLVTGSLMYEVDTGDVYAFDEVTNGGEWVLFASLNASQGGGGSDPR